MGSFIRFGPFSISLVLIPIVIGAATCGIKIGAWLGLVFGAVVMVTGGAEAPLTISGMGGFNSMHALSTRNDDPQTASRPFCKSRDGFVMGEGAGCLVLEELEHALSRGATIYAEIAGVGASADAHHITASHPEGLGAILAMKHALEDANMSIEDIDKLSKEYKIEIHDLPHCRIAVFDCLCVISSGISCNITGIGLVSRYNAASITASTDCTVMKFSALRTIGSISCKSFSLALGIITV